MLVIHRASLRRPYFLCAQKIGEKRRQGSALDPAPHGQPSTHPGFCLSPEVSPYLGPGGDFRWVLLLPPLARPFGVPGGVRFSVDSKI